MASHLRRDSTLAPIVPIIPHLLLNRNICCNMKSVSSWLVVVLAALVMLCLTSPASAFSTVRVTAVQKPAVTASPLSFHRPLSYSSASFSCSMASSSNESSTKSPLDRPVLAALDFAAILLFAFVGTSSHNSASDYLAVMAVAVPFLISWFTVTPFLGLYSKDATNDKVGALTTTAKGWILAIPLGCVLRGLIKGYVPPLPFVIVTMIATLVILGCTRVAYTALTEQSESSS
jgi:hypothetical protein